MRDVARHQEGFPQIQKNERMIGMDLFDFPTDDQSNLNGRPLADRMRPQTLDEFVGQEQIVGQGRLLRRAIQADKLTPMIFFGPPGTGKRRLPISLLKRLLPITNSSTPLHPALAIFARLLRLRKNA
ncbi:ATPase, AAA family [Sporolactobacillus inulinus]|uniref:ATPase, AAA family n=1 Tax=Sporolactobacillus inulinus TaxID=2078 RepID=A0A4Y1ZHG1_9BACL|nr:ATPase, AAA family [Sporolactobacillus inulinus]